MNSFRYLERGVEAEIERQRAIARGRRAGRAGDAPLRSAQRLADPAALEGVLATTTATSPSPTCRRWRRREAQIQAARDVPAGAARGRRERYESELGLSDEQATRIAFDAELADFFERALEAGEGVEAPVAGELGDGRARRGRPGRRRRRPGGDERDARRRSPRWPAMVAGKELNRGAGRRVLEVLASEGGDPARGRRAPRAPRRRSTRASSRRSSSGALEEQPDAAEKVRAGEGKAIGALVGPGHAGDEGPRRRRRGQPVDPREAGRLSPGQVASATL